MDQLERVSITNSTLINIGDQLMDVKGGIGDVILENCTFYNSMDARRNCLKFSVSIMRQVLRLLRNLRQCGI